MKNTFKETSKSYLSLFFITLAVVLILKVIFNFLALGIINQIWNFDALEVFYDLENRIFNLIYVHKILALFDQVGTFLIPSIVIFFLFKFLKPNYNRIEKIDYLKLFYSFIVLIGITQLLAYISISIGYDFLPESIKSYLKSQQDFNTTLQEKFIGESLLSFTYNILLLTIIPAIGEELFFRGLIQKIFIGIFKNTSNPVLYGIVTTSIIFGILHFQIENLLAIIFASVFFGYIYEKSKNITLTIILHFCFNLFALVNMQAIKIGLVSETTIEFLGNYIITPIAVILALIMIKKKIFWKEKSLLSVD